MEVLHVLHLCRIGDIDTNFSPIRAASKRELTFVIGGVRELVARLEIGWLIAKPSQGSQGLYIPIQGFSGDPYGNL